MPRQFRRWAVFVHRTDGWSLEETYKDGEYNGAVALAMQLLRSASIDRVGVQDMTRPGKSFAWADGKIPRREREAVTA